ncbi:MAG: DUF4476 domain-containing protein [Cytophagales bacterium]|nr:DUF4476 domain-containing protein [Cytophagales bacterium]MDW8384850.1 hypothetical protein [Flammeovirgaceae bacterium]
MKYLASVLWILHFWQTQAQSPCVNALSDSDFSQKVLQIRQLDIEKIPFGIQNVLDHHCLTSVQVSELLRLITTNEVLKADIAIRAYSRTLDKWNYFEVLEQFRSLSAAFRVYHQTIAFDSTSAAKNFSEQLVERPTKPSSANSSFANTSISANCSIPDVEFEQMYLLLSRNAFESARLSLAKQMIKDKQCISISQIEAIARLFYHENTIADFLSFAHFYTDKKSFQIALTQYPESIRNIVSQNIK